MLNLQMNTTHHYILCVPCTTTWKHVVSSLWMNTSNFIFRSIHIPNLSIVLSPPRLVYTPSVNYVNTFVDYIKFSTNSTNKFNVCANTLDDWANIFISSIDTLDNLYLDLCFLNPSLLKLLFTNSLIICSFSLNIVLTVGSSICFSSSVL